MSWTGLFLDANLLILLVAGSVDRGIIAKHRRLSGYSAEEYDRLRALLADARQVFVTPNTLTEASNLLAQHGEPERSRLLEELRDFIEESEEVVVRSSIASRRSDFVRLGLADAALLEVVSAETPLLSDDADLYLCALNKGEEAALNFTGLRPL